MSSTQSMLSSTKSSMAISSFLTVNVSLVHFINVAEYVNKENAYASIESMLLLPFKLDFKTFLTLKKYSFVIFVFIPSQRRLLASSTPRYL